MRRRAEGALAMVTGIAVADVFGAGGLAVTVLLVVAAAAWATLFVGLGWCWGRDDRIRARKTARR